MRVSAGVDYAVRAAVALAAEPGGHWVKGDVIAAGQALSFRYCEQLLADLRRAGLVVSHRGADGLRAVLERVTRRDRVHDLGRHRQGQGDPA